MTTMKSIRLSSIRLRRSFSYSLIYLVLIFVALVTLVPFLWIALSAFKNTMEIFSDPYALPKIWRWENFSRAWFQGRFNVYFFNTVYVTVPSVAGVVSLSAMCGYSLGKMSFPGKNGITTLMIMGLAIPLQSIIIPLYFVLPRFALIETLWGVIVSLIGVGLPFGVMLMRAFFLSVDSDYGDSGRVDGCNEFAVFRHIMVPLAKPAVLALIVLDFMWVWNAFLLPLLITHEESKRVLGLGLMFFRSRYNTQYGLLAAGVLISTVPITVVYLIFNRYFVEGLTAGGLKG